MVLFQRTHQNPNSRCDVERVPKYARINPIDLIVLNLDKEGEIKIFLLVAIQKSID
jgi:hypothetical protein